MDFVPKDLYSFVNWLIDSNSFDDFTESKDYFQAVSCCHSIRSSSLHTMSPIKLGLGVLLHHEYGINKLIKELYALCHCVSYDEVRRYLTSVALEQSHDDVYIPRGLKKVDDGSVLNDAAIENLDQNCYCMQSMYETQTYCCTE